MKNDATNNELCPDCDRYIGPASRCPYCHGIASATVVRRRMKIVALTLVVVGLLFLYLMAVNREIKLVVINDITPMMNYASVRIAGKVVRPPYISKNDGVVNYLSFLVDDGTGTLRVSARDDVAVAIINADKLPHKGDNIEVSGRLSVKGDGSRKLRILMAEQVVEMNDER